MANPPYLGTTENGLLKADIPGKNGAIEFFDRMEEKYVLRKLE